MATSEKHNSDYWSKELNVTIMDPDGWDRKNFAASWAEEITRDEFRTRLFQSTIMPNGWPLKEIGYE